MKLGETPFVTTKLYSVSIGGLYEVMFVPAIYTGVVPVSGRDTSRFVVLSV